MVLRGYFPDAEVVLRSLRDATIVWKIIADRVDYEETINGGLITLRISPRPVEVKEEPIDGSHEKTSVKSKNVDVGGEALDEEGNEREGVYIDAKKEPVDGDSDDKSTRFYAVACGQSNARTIHRNAS